MADIIDFRTRAAAEDQPLAVSDPLEPGQTDPDSIRMLDFYAELAKRGEVSGCLVVVFNPQTKRYSHAFSVPLGEDASNGALQMVGCLGLVSEDLRSFARATGDYSSFAQVSELTDLTLLADPDKEPEPA